MSEFEEWERQERLNTIAAWTVVIFISGLLAWIIVESLG